MFIQCVEVFAVVNFSDCLLLQQTAPAMFNFISLFYLFISQRTY